MKTTVDYEAGRRCPAYEDGKHQAGEDFREWRKAKAEGKSIACRCGLDVWPVCFTCGEPEIGWQRHAHDNGSVTP